MSLDPMPSIVRILRSMAPTDVDDAIVEYIAEEIVEAIQSGASPSSSISSTLTSHLDTYDIPHDPTHISIIMDIINNHININKHQSSTISTTTPSRLTQTVRLLDVVKEEQIKEMNHHDKDKEKDKDSKHNDTHVTTTSATTTTSSMKPLTKKQQRHASAIAAMDALIAELDDVSSDSDDEDGVCALCSRDMPLTRHHLIPRTMHRTYRRKGYSSSTLNLVTLICRPCHSACHKLITESDMASSYYTIELLRQHEDVQRWIMYARKQKCNRTKEQGAHHAKLRYAR